MDAPPPARAAAREKARERGLAARFLRHDTLRVAELAGPFDTVLDCGLFHMPHLTPADRAAFVTGLASVLDDGGRYLMLCFSDRVPDDQMGPHRFSREEISSYFSDGWLLTIEPATIEVTIDPAGRAAWLVDARRTRGGGTALDRVIRRWRSG